ncbi:MAG: MFS transporter [Rhodospirillaceae bacterium]|nr:MFS transporter [Rhodospirillaceae bacterium]
MATRWIMLGVLFVVRLSMGYQFQSVASVSSTLVADFGFSYAQVGTLIGLFLLPGIFISIPSGLMTRAVANKNLLMLGAVAMITGGVLMALSEGPSGLYTGRLITGVGGSIFNVILTKMVTEWFFEKEIVTALAIILTAWPMGIAMGLVSQGLIAETLGLEWVMYGTAGFALFGLVLTAMFYRDAPVPADQRVAPFRFGLPRRQFVHMALVSIAWALYNASIILLVSFAPDILIGDGYSEVEARSVTSLFMWVSLVSAPLGGRVIEVLGHMTATIIVMTAFSAVGMMAIAYGMATEVSFVVVGITLGVAVGALMSLSSEAVSPENRGPGLGIFYTWYYIGMTISPMIAGWTKDMTGITSAPVMLAAGMLVVTIICVGLFRLLQKTWPITT